MRLDELIGGLREISGRRGGDVEIKGLAYDSRAVKPGSLFFCVSGFRSDGHEFAPRAVESGAAALVVERQLELGVPEVQVPSARAAMPAVAAQFNGHPSRRLRVVGVTGTNGKTTSTYLIRGLLEAHGWRCGMLGTVKSVVGGVERPVERTTPEAVDLQADLRAMVDAGDRACAMEVSSHALELGRTREIAFAAALFTNLTQDHLDFHPTMEDYFLAKRRLFVPADGSPPPGSSVVNVGDEFGRRLAAELPGAVTYAIEADADYSARELVCSFEGTRFVLRTPEGAHELMLPLPGRFNVANAIGALAVVRGLGVPLDVLLEALSSGVRVPGRFEPVEEGQDFALLVDYAHTPDSLENVLAAARELLARSAEGGRLICVFGAGGDRDRGKRPLMGAIAARLADLVIVTSDNPRSEDPDAIIAEIMAGVPGVGGEPAAGADAPVGARRPAEVRTVSDRRAAIVAAVLQARHGDVVVIAGKGHEQGQELAGGVKIPFDDAAVASEALGERRAALAAPGARA